MGNRGCWWSLKLFGVSRFPQVFSWNHISAKSQEFFLHEATARNARVALLEGPPGLHTTARELQTCTFQGPGASNTTKIPRKKTQAIESKKNILPVEGKKPTLRGHTHPDRSPPGPPPTGTAQTWTAPRINRTRTSPDSPATLKTKSGQTWYWPNLVWPNLVLAKLSAGQTWCPPISVWPHLQSLMKLFWAAALGTTAKHHMSLVAHMPGKSTIIVTIMKLSDIPQRATRRRDLPSPLNPLEGQLPLGGTKPVCLARVSGSGNPSGLTDAARNIALARSMMKIVMQLWPHHNVCIQKERPPRNVNGQSKLARMKMNIMLIGVSPMAARPHQGEKFTRVSAFKRLIWALLVGARHSPTAISPWPGQKYWANKPQRQTHGRTGLNRASSPIHGLLVEGNIRPRLSPTEQSLFRSQGGPVAGVPFLFFLWEALPLRCGAQCVGEGSRLVACPTRGCSVEVFADGSTLSWGTHRRGSSLTGRDPHSRSAREDGVALEETDCGQSPIHFCHPGLAWPIWTKTNFGQFSLSQSIFGSGVCHGGARRVEGRRVGGARHFALFFLLSRHFSWNFGVV